MKLHNCSNDSGSSNNSDDESAVGWQREYKDGKKSGDWKNSSDESEIENELIREKTKCCAHPIIYENTVSRSSSLVDNKTSKSPEIKRSNESVFLPDVVEISSSNNGKHRECSPDFHKNTMHSVTNCSDPVHVLQPQTSMKLGRTPPDQLSSEISQSYGELLSDKNYNQLSQDCIKSDSPYINRSCEALEIEEEEDIIDENGKVISRENKNIYGSNILNKLSNYSDNCCAKNSHCCKKLDYEPNINEKEEPDQSLCDSESPEVHINNTIKSKLITNSIKSKLNKRSCPIDNNHCNGSTYLCNTAGESDSDSSSNDVMGREKLYQQNVRICGKVSHRNAANSDLLQPNERYRHKPTIYNQDNCNGIYSFNSVMGSVLSRGKETDKDKDYPSHERPTIASAAKARHNKEFEEDPLPSYVRQKSDSFKRFTGFSHVNSNNVRRMRDAWSNKKGKSNDLSFDKRCTSQSPVRDNGSNAPQSRYRSPPPLNSTKYPGEKSSPKGLSSCFKEFMNHGDSDDSAMNIHQRRIPKSYFSPTFSSNQKSNPTQKFPSCKTDHMKKDYKKCDSPLLTKNVDRKDSETIKCEKRYSSEKGLGTKTKNGVSYNYSNSRNNGLYSSSSDSYEPSCDLSRQNIYNRIKSPNLQPDSDDICFKEETDKYKMVIDVEEYVLGEVEVLQDNNLLTLKGKIEKKNGVDLSTKTFNRTFEIPKNCKEEDIDSSLSKDGILTIFVPKKRERIIKIELVD